MSVEEIFPLSPEIIATSVLCSPKAEVVLHNKDWERNCYNFLLNAVRFDFAILFFFPRPFICMRVKKAVLCVMQGERAVVKMCGAAAY